MKAFFKPKVERRLLKARDAWMRVMSDYRDERGLVCPPAPPMIEDRHLENCQVVASRDKIIQKLPHGGPIAEVGVLAGDFSQILINECSPTELHLIDLDLCSHKIHQRFADQIKAGKVLLHEGKSWSVLKKFTDQYFDFIYIDADHRYENVKKDIMVAKQKIRHDGFLVFNEFVFFALDPYMYCDVAIRRR